MTEALQFLLNGRPIQLADDAINLTLLDFLRARGLTGSKEGCAEGDCGACSVALLDHDSAGRPAWRAINSCLVPVALLARREVVTVEGVARDGLHPVQRAMIDRHASQCGYCTPGLVMSLFEGFYRDDLREPWQFDDQLCGNLCRCTGYRPIREALVNARVESPAGNGRVDAFAERLRQPAADLAAVSMTEQSGPFHRPASLEELFRRMAEHPGARLIAGATELGLELTKKFRRFSALISLETVPELTRLHATAESWEIGAAVTLTRLEELLSDEYPELAEMLRWFGSRQIRNRATLGGNLVTASPIGDSAPVLLALGAQVTLATARGERTLPLDDFFTGYRRTSLAAGEILKSIVLPRPVATPGQRSLRRFFKVSKRREMDISTVAACFAVTLDAANRVRHARLAYGGVAPTPARARRAEAALLGCEWSEAALVRVEPLLREEFSPISDVRGGAAYRRELVVRLFEKFLRGDPANHECERAAEAPRSEAACPGPATPHESAHLHVTGEALYTDDQTDGFLEVWPVCAPHAHARIRRRDATAARAMPGVRAVLLAEDIPGVNDVGPVRDDEPLLARDEVLYHGQVVALVVGDSAATCRAAAAAVVVEYEPLPPVLSIEAAIAAHRFHTEPNTLRRGNVTSALTGAPQEIEGEFHVAGQDHFYLETQSAWAKPGEDGTMFVMSSTQHPSEVQIAVAGVLGVPVNQVIVQVPRMGGGFGGKETQAAMPAALAALAAARTGAPVRVRFNRDQDMLLTGKRHPFLARFRAGFDEEGRVLAAKVDLFSDGGWSLDLSLAVTDRALFHLDNAYYLPNVEFTGRVCHTNLASNTAFRGFGGPQGMLVIEEILDRVARTLGLPPEEIRARNLYHGRGETNTTHYGQEIGDNRLPAIWQQLLGSSRFTERRREISAWNQAHPHRKRGLAITPVKFGISFTHTPLNHAGALVLIYLDGSVQVNHGGTEMGQGLHTNIRAITARELGVPPERIRVMSTSTDKVPNTSATAASCGTDLNGAAVKNACDMLRARLAPVAAALLNARTQRAVTADEVRFEQDRVFAAAMPDMALSFTEVIRQAHADRIGLSATGHYRTPEVHFDRAAGRGRPFYYFACGAAVTEAEVDGFTGMTQIRRVDILHDVGQPINAGVNRGQIEGGFVQGLGWLTCEELKWDDQGRLLTHSPDTYKIPAVGDAPREFRVAFLTGAAQTGVIHGSKAVGEPPLMLAISAREAIRDAVAAFGPAGGLVNLSTPATPEAVFLAIRERSGRGELNVASRH